MGGYPCPTEGETPMTNFVRYAALAAGGLLISATAALAGPTYTFTTSTGVQPSNVGIITLTQVDTNIVKVLVDLLDTSLPAPRYGFLNTGGPHTPFAFTIAGDDSALTASFLQPFNGHYNVGMTLVTLSLNAAGGDATPFGTFGVAIDSTAGLGSGKGYYGDLEFTLTRFGGLSTDDFITYPGGSSYFAADLTNGTNTGSQAWQTRSVVEPPSGRATDVPEPASMALLGSGLLGLGFVAKRRKSG